MTRKLSGCLYFLAILAILGLFAAIPIILPSAERGEPLGLILLAVLVGLIALHLVGRQRGQ